MSNPIGRTRRLFFMITLLQLAHEIAEHPITRVHATKSSLKLRDGGTVEGNGWKLERLLLAPPFQVERVTIAPNTIVPPHSHPNVDSYEIYISGIFTYVVNGRSFSASPKLRPERRMILVPHGVFHGGQSTETGGVFLSVQEWLDGNPRHISEDWIGVMEEKTLRLDY